MYDIYAMYDSKHARSEVFYCVVTRREDWETYYLYNDIPATATKGENQSVLCTIQVENTLLFPGLTHLDPHCTTCNNDNNDDHKHLDPLLNCSAPYTVPFFIFFPFTGETTNEASAIVSLLSEHNMTKIRLAVSHLAYSVSLNNSHGVEGLQNLSLDSALFDTICPPDLDCAVLWASHGDSANSVTPYGLQFPNMHCGDTVTSPHFSKLVNFPAKFTESYFECRKFLNDNVLDSISVSFGNTQIFATFFLGVLMLPGMYFCTLRARRAKEKWQGWYEANSPSPASTI
jgi:hypothetical protein